MIPSPHIDGFTLLVTAIGFLAGWGVTRWAVRGYKKACHALERENLELRHDLDVDKHARAVASVAKKLDEVFDTVDSVRDVPGCGRRKPLGIDHAIQGSDGSCCGPNMSRQEEADDAR